ncbi:MULTISPECIES: GtrA family protein [Bacillus]|uniref:Polysaccharide biosynthesis protein n=2 Tax=Bacillus TaxID=1386 RepID=A0A0M4FE66_9BACI|nr:MULTISPECIES: GtrA family protein [Bacillus]ALC80399.1 polysaccharide biosynthesis protein [Bacillus gobiensis]MBP1083746.1 putative flippase GtrA [Bacillus capparidis]MED1098231.1 GtrA family protein [Bacillus capparidis]
MKKINFEFFRFVIVGGINTGTYYLIYLSLLKLAHFDYMAAHLTGFVISLVISFFLNCFFTFKTKPTLAKFLQFPLTQLFNVIMSSILIYVFVDVFSLSSVIAPIAALFITVPVTYIVTGKILKKEKNEEAA